MWECLLSFWTCSVAFAPVFDLFLCANNASDPISFEIEGRAIRHPHFTVVDSTYSPSSSFQHKAASSRFDLSHRQPGLPVIPCSWSSKGSCAKGVFRNQKDPGLLLVVRASIWAQRPQTFSRGLRQLTRRVCQLMSWLQQIDWALSLDKWRGGFATRAVTGVDHPGIVCKALRLATNTVDCTWWWSLLEDGDWLQNIINAEIYRNEAAHLFFAMLDDGRGKVSRDFGSLFCVRLQVPLTLTVQPIRFFNLTCSRRGWNQY